MLSLLSATDESKRPDWFCLVNVEATLKRLKPEPASKRGHLPPATCRGAGRGLVLSGGESWGGSDRSFLFNCSLMNKRLFLMCVDESVFRKTHRSAPTVTEIWSPRTPPAASGDLRRHSELRLIIYRSNMEAIILSPRQASQFLHKQEIFPSVMPAVLCCLR